MREGGARGRGCEGDGKKKKKEKRVVYLSERGFFPLLAKVHAIEASFLQSTSIEHI